MKKIIVIGANQGALVFAEFAAKAGFDVTVFEAVKKKEVAYDWTDDMVPGTFAEVGLPLPPKETYTLKRCWTFVPPSKNAHILVDLPDSERDISVYRRPLNNWLEGRAVAAGAKVVYERPVESLIIENGRVAGVNLKSGDSISADFVLDCAGAQSATRSSLPDSFNIPQKLDFNDAFFVRRSFFESPEGTERPKYTNKAYLLHIGEPGISWCLLSHDEKAGDVLIGRVGKMSDETYANALADIRKDNPIVGDKLICGGQPLVIPVRHPISRMVANGYALLGDSAYMTIPMLGSGMASGMKAAKMLVDVIVKPVGADPFAISNLYRYQQAFMKEIGGKHAAIDLMKRWLLSANANDVDFLIGKGVVSEKVLIQGSTGQMVTLSLPELLATAVKGAAKLPLLLKLAKLLLQMQLQCSTAEKMPASYDEQAFKAWQEKYEKAYK